MPSVSRRRFSEISKRLFLGLALLLVVSCSVSHRSSAQVSRAEVLAIAESYCQHRWKPIDANVKHGKDSHGVQVDTPDISYQPTDGTRGGWWKTDQWNVGIPYQWGGFDTLGEFDRKVKKGHAAGDVYTLVKRAALDDAVSDEAAGIDCSGFVSRCWKLKKSFSTRELPELCDLLPSYDDLKSGDILNTHNSHVVIFLGWGNHERTQVRVYEAGTYPGWKVARQKILREYLTQKGFQPYRYRGIRD